MLWEAAELQRNYFSGRTCPRDVSQVPTTGNREFEECIQINPNRFPASGFPCFPRVFPHSEPQQYRRPFQLPPARATNGQFQSDYTVAVGVFPGYRSLLITDHTDYAPITPIMSRSHRLCPDHTDYVPITPIMPRSHRLCPRSHRLCLSVVLSQTICPGRIGGQGGAGERRGDE